jgi:hypothetical protein
MATEFQSSSFKLTLWCLPWISAKISAIAFMPVLHFRVYRWAISTVTGGQTSSSLVLEPLFLAQGNVNFADYVTGQPGGLTGDFNGDGLTDFESNTDRQMQVSLSNGDGTFRDGFLLSSNKLGAMQAPADFNGDGILDLLSLIGLNAPLSLFFGKDDGSFVDSGISLLPNGGSYLTAIADFERNGSSDIAILDPTAGVVTIALNKNSFQLTNTALSESSSKVIVGGPIKLSASVAAQQGTPTGNVEFKQAGAPQTTLALSSGVAQVTLTAPSLVGTYSFTALYTGSGTFAGSLSQRLLVTGQRRFDHDQCHL